MVRRFFEVKIINKILDEEYIQVKARYKDTVERLQQMQTLSEVSISSGQPLTFRCNDKGQFEVGASDGKFFNGKYGIIGTYRVEGEVCQINEKTVVKIRLICKQILRLILITLSTLCAIASILLLFKNLFVGANVDGVMPRVYSITIFLVISILADAIFIHGIFTQKTHKTEDLELMKAEILKRIEAVENWDK